MKRHHFYIGLIVTVLSGAGIFYVLNGGYYPVAVVNGSVISANEFERVATAALHFYVKSSEAAKRRTLTPEEVDALYAEIRRGTLDKLIGERLVDAELMARLGERAAVLAEEKVDMASSDELRAAVPALYGIVYADFRDMLLVPEAKVEVLKESLGVDSIDAQTWFSSARDNARVMIGLPKLVWQNGGVEIKK